MLALPFRYILILSILFSSRGFQPKQRRKDFSLTSSQQSSSKPDYFTIEDVEFYGMKSGIFLKATTTGPSLRLEAFVKDDLDIKIGYLTAFIRPFPFGLLQLDTIQVLNRRQTLGFKREGWTMNGPGICFIMGSWALLWAYRKGCRRAEVHAHYK